MHNISTWAGPTNIFMPPRNNPWLCVDQHRSKEWAHGCAVNSHEIKLNRKEDGSFEVPFMQNVSIDAATMTVYDGVAYMPICFQMAGRFAVTATKGSYGGEWPKTKISLKGYGITSLAGVNGLFDFIGGKVRMPVSVRSNVLGLLLIPGAVEIQFLAHITDYPTADDQSTPFLVGEILTRHLKDRDVLKCQEELIDNGFEDYAAL